jgi:hypothetical protein
MNYELKTTLLSPEETSEILGGAAPPTLPMPFPPFITNTVNVGWIDTGITGTQWNDGTSSITFRLMGVGFRIFFGNNGTEITGVNDK